MQLLYTPIISALLSIFTCKEKEDGSFVVLAAPHLLCYDTDAWCAPAVPAHDSPIALAHSPIGSTHHIGLSYWPAVVLAVPVTCSATATTLGARRPTVLDHSSIVKWLICL